MAILYWWDFAMFAALTLYAASEAQPYTAFTASFALAGYLSWVFLEYGMHRFVFHDRRSPAWHAHMAHHRSPMAEEGFLPIWLSMLGAGTSGLWATITLGSQPGMAFWTGLLLGYQTYIWTHHAIHVGWIKGAIAQRHELHHRGWAFNYNLLCPLGDLVFGTYKRSVKK